MDHPGWVQPDDGTAALRFLGGVPIEYQEANRERIQSFGNFAMWDLPACEWREDRVYSRACDDLIGCATIVAALERIAHTGFQGECYGLFTRAEEVGFAGAIELARTGWLANEALTVISLETSAERPPARMGAGPIVRVGDKTSVFDGTVTAELMAAAAGAGITVQRCLMSGGTCEATPFRLYGVRCGALCVALGNYHNCAPDLRIEPEFVSVEDVLGLVALCSALVLQSLDAAEPDLELRARLERNLMPYENFRHRDQPPVSL
jgi:endoglucanase